MIENLKSYMKRNHNYKLTEFKICSAEQAKSRTNLFPIYLYIVVLIGYALQVLNVIPQFYNLTIVMIIGVLIAIFQIILIKKDKEEALVVTPEFIIKCIGKKTFVAVKYDEIKTFKVNDSDGLIISDRRNEISISPVCYQADLEPIVDILEAKGKTFDKSRDYMKRPIKISIKKNKIIVSDVKQEESTTEKLVGKYYEEFKMLTPGFIKDVLFMNSVIDDVYENDKNLIFRLDKIEVRAGHPENTGFESLMGHDCIVIFENVVVKSASIRKVRERDAKEEVLPKKLDTIISNVGKGVISNWKYHKTGIDLYFAVGVSMLTVSFDYKEVIIGWKTLK